MAVKLGEMLLKAGLISQPQLQDALEAQKKNGGKLGFNLVKLGYVKEDDITQLLSDQYGVPSINLCHFEIDETVIDLVPSEVAQKYLVLPVNRTGATLTIAMADPTNVFAMDDIKFMTGYNVEPVVASEIAIREFAWPSPAPETAITALRWSNVPEAVEALRELADAHPDPGIRSLAALAIGRPLGDAH